MCVCSLLGGDSAVGHLFSGRGSWLRRLSRFLVRGLPETLFQRHSSAGIRTIVVL